MYKDCWCAFAYVYLESAPFGYSFAIKNPTTFVVGFLILQGRGFEPIAVQYPGEVLLPPVQKLAATFEKTGHIKNPVL